MSYSQRQGFSLVEVVLALGVCSFALLSIMALLPAGIKSNMVSKEETQASYILTVLESDLRNSHPLATSLLPRRSAYLKLLLPYDYNTTTAKPTFNASITGVTTALTDGLTTTGLDEAGKPISLSSSTRSVFRASIIYTRVPTSPSLAPLEARLIVNWPALSTSATIADLTDRTKVSGYVEALVAFPAP